MKKILIITQKVNMDDQILGFFHRWIIEFAKHYSQVTVICLERGRTDLPKNVRVFSLGKEESISRIKYLINFYKYILAERNNYDLVFVHMNPIYVLLGGLVWKVLNKDIYLWYTHKTVDFKLRLSEKLVKNIFSASQESFRLKTNKLVVMGHGIDTDYFISRDEVKNSKFTVLTVGRVSPVKNQMLIIKAVEKLLLEGCDCYLQIVGGPVTMMDEEYNNELIKYVNDNNLKSGVQMVGAIIPQKIVGYYQSSNVFVNLSQTGSLDKAVLEAMACEIIPITSNIAFAKILEPYKDLCLLDTPDSSLLAEKIKKIISLKDIGLVARSMRKEIKDNHNLNSLIDKLANRLNKEQNK
jgi:glycosyltransferase involved in cell wall biosynthesis